MNFTKKNIPVAKGIQSSRYDKLLPEFVEAGDTLEFEESDLTRAAASQAAKRLMILDGSRKFHSGWNPVAKKVFIRVRPDGEIADKNDEKEEEDEPQMTMGQMDHA